MASLIILRYSEKLNTKKINYIKISFILALITCGIGVIHSRMGFLVSFIVVFISIYLKRNKLNFKLLFYFFVLAIILIFLIMPTIFNITENILIKGTGNEIKSLTISCSYNDYFLSQQYGQEFKNPYCDELRDTFINKKNIDLGRLYFRKFQPCSLLTSLVIFDVQCSLEMKENDKISQYSDSTLRTTEQNNLIWRTNLWSQIFDNLALNPKSLIFGIGFNNSIPEFFNLDQKYYIIDSAHNSFLSAMAWCGVIGLFIFIILKKFAFNLIEKNPLYHWKILFMISYILLSFADSTFETPSNSILYWVVIATRSNYKNKV